MYSRFRYRIIYQQKSFASGCSLPETLGKSILFSQHQSERLGGDDEGGEIWPVKISAFNMSVFGKGAILEVV